MAKSVNTYLRNRTILLIILFLGMFIISIFSSSYLYYERTLDSSIDSLSQSVKGQTMRVEPSLILPEQWRGLQMILNEVKIQEYLTDIRVISSQEKLEIVNHLNLKCITKSAIIKCKRLVTGVAAVFHEIGSEDQELGLLYKMVRIGNFNLDAVVASKQVQSFLAIALMVFALIVVVTSLFTNQISGSVDQLRSEIKRSLSNNGLRISPERYEFTEFEELSETTQRLITDYQEASLKAESAKIDRAIAQTTQMLAHDVRKPFTMIAGILEMIKSSNDPVVLSEITKEAIPEVQQAIHAVNGMIADIMGIGKPSSLSKEPVDPSSLFETSIKQAFRHKQNAHIVFSYEFKHSYLVEADILKVLRVFANIIGNGSEAMGHRGHMWFATRNVMSAGVNYVEFGIRNSGSVIPPVEIDKLFDAFYTKNKKGGTGLGLAICQKVIHEHGGIIRCESSEEKGTEFLFTIPSSKDTCPVITANLPKSSLELLVETEKFSPTLTSKSDERSREESDLELSIIKKTRSLKRSANVLIVDDEGIYRKLLEHHIANSKELASVVHLNFATTGQQAVEIANQGGFDVIIMDVDLGKASLLSGFETVVELRKSGIVSTICIHSNRGIQESQKATQEAGADYFLPKPLSRMHFLKVIVSSLETSPVKADKKLPARVVVLDDNFIFRMSWQKVVGKESIVVMESPEVFYQKIAAGELQEEDIRCLITDQDFGELSSTSGLEMAEKLKSQGFLPPIFLSSNTDHFACDLSSTIAGVLSKNAADAWQQVQAKLGTTI